MALYPPPYPVGIGATKMLYIGAASGDASTATVLKANIKAVASPQTPVPPETDPAVGTLNIRYQATSPGTLPDGTVIPPGWYAELTKETTATLAEGYYVTDVAFQVGSGVYPTNPVLIQVVNVVSLPWP